MRGRRRRRGRAQRIVRATRAVNNDIFPTPDAFLRDIATGAADLGCAAPVNRTLAELVAIVPYNDINSATCTSESKNVDPLFTGDSSVDPSVQLVGPTSPLADSAPSTLGCDTDRFWDPVVDGALEDFFDGAHLDDIGAVEFLL